MGWQFEIFQTAVHSWAWKLRRPNGVMLCMSDEKYTSVGAAEEAIVEMRNLPTNVKIIDMDSPKEVKKRSVGTSPRKSKKVEKKPKKKKTSDS